MKVTFLLREKQKKQINKHKTSSQVVTMKSNAESRVKKRPVLF